MREPVHRREHRRHPRYGRVLAALYRLGMPERVPRGSLAARTENISEGGLLLRLPEVLQPSTNLDLKLYTGWDPIVAEAEVVWAEALSPGGTTGGYRHGVRFTEISPEVRKALQTYLTHVARV